jgi:hypothetical protein
MLIEQREDAGGVSADEIAHARIEAIVDMRENEVQVRLGWTNGLDLAASTPPAAAWRARRETRGIA